MKSASLFAVFIGATTSDAFSVSSQHNHQSIIQPSTTAAITTTTTTTSSTSTALYGKRRGGLGNNVSLDDDGNVKLISNKRKQKLGNSDGGSRKGNKRGKGNAGSDDGAISPLLAEWAKEDGDGGATTAKSYETRRSARAVTSSASSDVFASFEPSNKKKKKNRRNKNDDDNNNKKSNKKSNRLILSAEQTSRMDEILERIAEMLGTTNCNVSELVSNIASLADLNASFSNDQVLLPTLKSILSARPPRISSTGDDDDDSKSKNRQPSYRLAWVGSDSAICHVGTSLHKLPLARLQEMYLLLGYGRWELLEVLRLLGPFPNVRNTLKGDIKVEKMRGGGAGGREGAKLEISYLSMIDGTGKEILAGKEENIKVVELDVWFANERAIVCSAPREDGEGDPLSGDGSDVMLFVAEENLDEELEKLRAA